MNRIAKYILAYALMAVGVIFLLLFLDPLEYNLLYMFIGGLSLVIGILNLPKSETPIKKFEREIAKNSYYCEKCQGVTMDSFCCENPSCPNQPCCGKPLSKCDCNQQSVSL